MTTGGLEHIPTTFGDVADDCNPLFQEVFEDYYLQPPTAFHGFHQGGGDCWNMFVTAL